MKSRTAAFFWSPASSRSCFWKQFPYSLTGRPSLLYWPTSKGSIQTVDDKNSLTISLCALLSSVLQLSSDTIHFFLSYSDMYGTVEVGAQWWKRWANNNIHTCLFVSVALLWQVYRCCFMNHAASKVVYASQAHHYFLASHGNAALFLFFLHLCEGLHVYNWWRREGVYRATAKWAQGGRGMRIEFFFSAFILDHIEL